MIKVTNEVQVYDDNKFSTEKTLIRVHSHWNENRAVEIEFEGKRYKVYAEDMIAALKNATNTNRF